FIANIEQIHSESFPSAHVKMDFYLRNSKQKIVIVHRVNRDVPVNDNTMNSVVQTMTEIISEEYDKFLIKVDDYFINGVEITNEIPKLVNEVTTDNYDLEVFETRENLMGELIVPNLSQSDNAPSLRVMGLETDYDQSIQMGVVKTLPRGTYTLHLGQGQETDIIESVDVKPKYRTIVKPSWGCLTINIIDQSKTKVRMQYDIYHAEDNGSVGFDMSVTDDAGEENRVWVLKKGRYFITVNGAAYYSYIDFTTIDIAANKNYVLTLVVDPLGANSKLVGAGIHPQEVDLNETSRYSSQNAFHLNFNLSSNNNTAEKDFEQSLNLSSQFDKKMIYETDRLDYEGRVIWDLGLSKASKQDMQISNDNFKINNTLIFNLWGKGTGLYGRYNVKSHFFQKFEYYDEPYTMMIYNNGNVADSLHSVDKVKINNAIFPLEMREGFGLNYRINNGQYGNVNFRLGIGWQQDFYNSALNRREDPEENEEGEILYYMYDELEDSTTQGVETAIIANFTIPKLRLTWSSTVDLLIPIKHPDEMVFDFDNIFNIKLINNVSWDVKVNMGYDKAVKDYMIYETSSFIRLSYFF
ncbi:MAG: hypothetical protein B6226_05925, partial [Candidatus Cloacimonetes bacterium 4572_65]